MTAHQESDAADLLLRIKEAEESARTLVSEAMEQKDVLIRAATERVTAWEAQQASEIRNSFSALLDAELKALQQNSHGREAQQAADAVRQAAEKKSTAAQAILAKEFDVLLNG